MKDLLKGTKVIEVASWIMVPAAGAVLADFGADVIKIEHPERPDPIRALTSAAVGHQKQVNVLVEQANRGKRSVGLALETEEGRALLYAMVRDADVFLTNFLPDARQRLGIDVQHIRSLNPNIVYARGTGQGTRGPNASKGGFDGAQYWAQGGIATALNPGTLDYPLWSRTAFGDAPAGLALGLGVVAALLRRDRTGATSVVDLSLLSLALWNLFPDILSAVDNADSYVDGGSPRYPPRTDFPNPLTNFYRTLDGRFIWLSMMEGDRYWPDFCLHIERPDLLADRRFRDMTSRFEHRRECIAELDIVFATRTCADWCDRLAALDGVWAPVQNALEARTDPQVVANGYLSTVQTGDGHCFQLVSNPVQFDEEAVSLSPAPEHGQHTDEILTAMGLDWERIVALKLSGAVL